MGESEKNSSKIIDNKDNSLISNASKKSFTGSNTENITSPNNIQNQNVTPKKPSPNKENNSSPKKNETIASIKINENPSNISLKTPETQKDSKINHLSPIIDDSPLQKTKNLVNKWELVKEDNKKSAEASKFESNKIQKTSIPSKNASSNFTPISDFSKSENDKKSISQDETKITDYIPEITKKFSMKEKRLRETIKTFNQSYNTANIDLKDFERKFVTVKPIIKEKRVYLEDVDGEDKVQRSKRVKVSELRSSNNTSIWHIINSSIFSLKDILNKPKPVQNPEDEDVKGIANESIIITPTVKHQEVIEPVRLNEMTCLNIFNPSANKSTIPLLLRLRKGSSSNGENINSLNMFAKSNTKPEWINKLYMVISNESKIPKLFDVPVHWTSLSSQMVYILDLSGEALIQFNGSNSFDGDRDYAQRISKRISLNDNVPDIFEIDQEKSYNNKSVPLKLFWKALELDNYSEEERETIITKNDTLNLSTTLIKNKKKIDIERAIYIYRINEQTHSLDLIHNGSFPTCRCLNSNVSMIFDFVGEVYLWQGKNSSLNARSKGIKFAQKIFHDYSRPS